MFRNVSIGLGAIALSVSSAAFADSTVSIVAGQPTSGSQNLYLCNDESGTPVLMVSCPDPQEPAYDVVISHPHPPQPVNPGDLIVYNKFGQSYIIRDVLPNSGDVVIGPEDLSNPEYVELLYDDAGNYIGPDPEPYSGGLQATGGGVTASTAAINNLGSVPPVSPSAGGASFEEADRSGGGGGVF